MAVMVAVVMLTFVQQTIRYHTRPTLSKVTVKDQTPIEFPAITICNNNYVRKDVALENNFTQKILYNQLLKQVNRIVIS